MNRWKALASATIVAALVLAPMAANADEQPTDSPPGAAVEAVTAGAQPADTPAITELPDTAEPDTSVPTAKVQTFAAVTAVEEEEEVPVESKWVFVCKYVGTPNVDERLQPSDNNPISVSVNSIAHNQWNGQVPGWFSDAHDRSYVLGYDPEKGDGQNNEPPITDCPLPDGPPVLVIPDIPVIHDPCGTAEDEYVLPADSAAVEYSYHEGSILAHRLSGDGWGELPDGWVDNDDGGTATWVGNEGDFTDWDCPYPVPTAFDTEPGPASCDAPGSFSTAFLGDRVPVDEGDGWAVYEFENVFIEVDRSVEGEVTLYIWAKDGFFLTETEGWEEFENEVYHYYYRTFLIPEQLDPNDPECITEYPVPTVFNADPEPPTCDSAGSFSTAFLDGREPVDEGEGWAVYEYENVFIEVDRTVDGEVTLYIWPMDGYVLTDTEGWTEVEGEGGLYYYRTILIPEQLSGPVACPLAEPPADPTPTPAPAALPATGGTDMTPWGIAAALMLLMGAALVATRRLARR